jgi:hypothetical protein
MTPIWADNYKVLDMNSEDIWIGGHRVKRGMEFNDKSLVFWKERDAMRVINMKTKRQALMVANARNTSNQTVYEILTSNCHLSTHKGSDNDPIHVQLCRRFENEYALMDSIMVSVKGLDMPAESYIVASYEYDGEYIIKRLDIRKGHIIFDRTLFNDGQRKLQPRDILLTIELKQDGNPLGTFVKDDIILTVLPPKL